MSQFWSSVVHGLSPYSPGEQPPADHWIKLNTNENPYPPSPQVVAAVSEESSRLRLYPEPDADSLKRAVAELHGLRSEQVFAGNGSDEILAHVFLALLRHELPLLFPDITYSFYPVYCALYSVPFLTVPLDSAFQIRVADYARPNGGIILANPNAPTGCLLASDQIEWLARQHPNSVVAIDEAYVDFGGDSVIPVLPRHDNVLVIRTLSKSHSLAGLRVGYAVGHPDLIVGLERVKNCFNSYPLDRLAIKGAAAALRDREYFETTRRAVMQNRDVLRQGLVELRFEVLPSAANFLFARHPDHDAADLQSALRQRRILVRHFAKPRIAQYLRISVGTEQDNRALLAALAEII